MKLSINLFLVLAFSVLLAACNGVEEGIAGGYKAVTIAAKTTKTLHVSGYLKDEQVAMIKTDLQTVKDTLDESTALIAADNTGEAKDRLQQAEFMLLTIQRVLNAAKARQLAGEETEATGDTETEPEPAVVESLEDPSISVGPPPTENTAVQPGGDQ